MVTVSGGERHTCLIDAEVSPEERQSVEATALSFVKTLLGTSPSEAYAMMTAEIHASNSREAWAASVKDAVRTPGQYRDIRVAHTYLIESTGKLAAGRAGCGVLEGHQWVSVALKPERKQAYVAILARSLESDWNVTVWLLPEAGHWAVDWFRGGMASLAGRSDEEVLQLARNERDAGHGFNAGMLYVSLRALIDRGSHFQLAITQDVDKDIDALEVPPEVRGAPPHNWNLAGKEYTVDNAYVVTRGGKLGLLFELPFTTQTAAKEAVKFNREFITGFIAAHPDYSRVFEYLVARAISPGRSMGLDTEYVLEDGFR